MVQLTEVISEGTRDNLDIARRMLERFTRSIKIFKNLSNFMYQSSLNLKYSVCLCTCTKILKPQRIPFFVHFCRIRFVESNHNLYIKYTKIIAQHFNYQTFDNISF